MSALHWFGVYAVVGTLTSLLVRYLLTASQKQELARLAKLGVGFDPWIATFVIAGVVWPILALEYTVRGLASAFRAAKKLTWLGALNFLVLQWFGVRLARVTCPNCERIRVNVWSYRCKYHRRTTLIRWVWPLTGWWSEYRRIAPRYWRWLQLITNVHRIHHDRWSYGYTFRPIPWAHFPAFTTRQGERIRHGWRRVKRGQFHDCTTSGVY